MNLREAAFGKATRFTRIALWVCLFVSLSCTRSRPVTIRLAGDEWFLDSLTRTATIGAFERQSGIHVEVLHKNDRAIMNELDHAAGDGNAALDVVVMRHRWLGALVQKGQARP